MEKWLENFMVVFLRESIGLNIFLEFYVKIMEGGF